MAFSGTICRCLKAHISTSLSWPVKLPSPWRKVVPRSSCLSISAAMGREQGYLEDHLEQISDLTNAISNGVDSLEWDLDTLPEDPRERAVYMRDVVRRDMGQLREVCDRAERIIPEDVWPIPTYTDLVHYV